MEIAPHCRCVVAIATGQGERHRCLICTASCTSPLLPGGAVAAPPPASRSIRCSISFSFLFGTLSSRDIAAFLVRFVVPREASAKTLSCVSTVFRTAATLGGNQRGCALILS